MNRRPSHTLKMTLLLLAMTGGLVCVTPPSVLAQDDAALIQKAGGYFSQGKYNEASREYRNALKANPSNPYAYLGLGLSLKAQGNLQEAQAVLQKLIAMDPGFAPAYYNLGMIQEARGDVAGARNSYRLFVQYSNGQIPEDPEIRIKLRKMGVM